MATYDQGKAIKGNIKRVKRNTCCLFKWFPAPLSSLSSYKSKEIIYLRHCCLLSTVIYVFTDCSGPWEQMVINVHGLQIPRISNTLLRSPAKLWHPWCNPLKMTVQITSNNVHFTVLNVKSLQLTWLGSSFKYQKCAFTAICCYLQASACAKI